MTKYQLLRSLSEGGDLPFAADPDCTLKDRAGNGARPPDGRVQAVERLTLPGGPCSDFVVTVLDPIGVAATVRVMTAD